MGLVHHLFYSALTPPALFIVTALLGLGAAIVWPRFGRGMTLVSLAGLYALATPFAAGELLRILERRIPSGDGGQAAAQAIVVLGGDATSGAAPESERLGALSLERVYDAARIYRVRHLPILVSGGALEKGGPPLADLMADVLTRDFGVPVEWRERDSRSTRENARFSARLLRKAGISDVLVVTEAWHMARALWSFDHAGLNAIPAKVPRLPVARSRDIDDFLPNAKSLLDSFYACHEMIGLIDYEYLD